MSQLILAASLSAWHECVPGCCAIKCNIGLQMNLKYSIHSPKEVEMESSATVPRHFLP